MEIKLILFDRFNDFKMIANDTHNFCLHNSDFFLAEMIILLSPKEWNICNFKQNHCTPATQWSATTNKMRSKKNVIHTFESVKNANTQGSKD